MLTYEMSFHQRGSLDRSKENGVQVCDDLKAFERRLTEVISCVRPRTTRWRIVLFLSTVMTAIGAFQWLTDPLTSQISFFESLLNHPFFTINCCIFLLFLLMGIHKRVVAPQILVSRVRQVLFDFNMSCDDNGRLMLKPRIPTLS